MATARIASRGSDVAAELGTLLQVHSLITRPRWKAEADRTIAPVLGRFHIGPETPAHHDAAEPPAFDMRAERIRMRGIRARSIRAGTGLRLVRTAIARGDFATAIDIAGEIVPQLYWQRAQLVIARGYFEHACTTQALRLVRLVRDHRIVAERQLLLGEIRLVVRPHTEANVGLVVEPAQLRVAVPSPSWTELEPQPSPKSRYHLMMATAWIRLGLRTEDPASVQRAVWHLIDAGIEPAVRRTFLAILARSSVPVMRALLAMRTAQRGGIVEAYFTTYVEQRSHRLLHADVPTPFAYGATGWNAPTNDARSIDRALFDEGVSLSEHASKRRRVLISTARTCLRHSLTESGWTDDVIDARLRTLVNLGGTLGADAIIKALDNLPATPDFLCRAVEALSALDPPSAAQILLARAAELSSANVDRLLSLVEIRRGVPEGFARAYRRAASAIGKPTGAAWLTGLVAKWRAEVGGVPDPVALAQIADRETIPHTPHELCRQLEAAGNVVLGDAHDRVIETIAKDRAILDALLVIRPARVDKFMAMWPVTRWRSLVNRVVRRRDFVDRNTLVHAAKLLGLPYNTLRVAALPVTPLRPFRADGREYRLRFLDKRVDLLTYLRFADTPTRCCFRSDQRRFLETPMLDVWKDPLSFCFHVERYHRSGVEPCGFVFGNFVDLDGRPGVVLNGLYVRPRTEAMRIGTVRAFEDAFCKQLGITEVGIAAVNNGYGPLPSNYIKRAVELTRLRALGHAGRKIVDGYDDISGRFNTRVVLSNLYWRT